MGGFDLVQRHSDNAKVIQIFSKDSSGRYASIAVVMHEDGTKEVVTDCPIQIGDVQIERIFDNGVRLIKISGARGNEGYSLRFSPDSGELYLDGRAVHAKADTAGYADTAGSANTLGGKAESALSVNYANSAGSAGNAGTLGGKAESALSVAYARDSGAINGKAESALSVAFAGEAQNAYAVKGAETIIFNYPNTQTLPGYGTWMIFYTTVVPGSIYNQFPAIVAGGTVLSLDREGSMARGIAIRTA